MADATPLTVTPKPAVQSTQNWMNVVLGTALSAANVRWPWLQAHPQVSLAVTAVANILWRTFITKTPIEGIL